MSDEHPQTKLFLGSLRASRAIKNSAYSTMIPQVDYFLFIFWKKVLLKLTDLYDQIALEIAQHCIQKGFSVLFSFYFQVRGTLLAASKMERSGRDRSKKVAAVEAGLKQAAENKRRKIGNPKKQKKMKTAPAVALLAEFPSAPVTAVLDQTTVVTPMVKTLLDLLCFLCLWYFL